VSPVTPASFADTVAAPPALAMGTVAAVGDVLAARHGPRAHQQGTSGLARMPGKRL
jgi:hypothetical protein